LNKLIHRTIFGFSILLSLGSNAGLAQECGIPEVWRQFSFLHGSWKVENSNLFENWDSAGDDVMVGKVYSLSGKDTILNETIQLIFDQSQIIYKAKVSGQNAGLAIPFRLAKCTPGLFIFENAEHDYPNKIGYRLVGKDKLLVWIEGIQNGKQAKSEWAMRKIQRFPGN
jgi:hypothetical protein